MKPPVFLAAVLVAAVAHAADVDFSHDIAPVLRKHCSKCHTKSQQKGGFSLNTRASLLAGGKSGEVVVVGKGAESDLIDRINSTDDDYRMPPESEPLSADEIALLTRWIDEGAKWEVGFTFGERAYEPPLRPRRPELPAARDGREHPIDRILDAYLAKEKRQTPAPLDDAAFLRRVSLDLVGLLPTPEQRQVFLQESSADKRTKLVRELLARDVDYAEHWLTFWNDLLRNDYTGTGFITGGRTQISKWLYHALVTNKPYDEFARELIAPPTPESAGFANGIRWRGEVSAGQTVEIQFAQNVGQAFLGINLKCASCHDSFIDHWTLADSYGLAAIYAQQPLSIHRCDKPIGKQAQAAWLFPELGEVDGRAPQPERLQQLAALMTHRDNGRFTRTIVNRLWQRMMGRGIVHPLDAMQSEPWNADLLDYLAEYFVDHQYDLKKVLEHIATSQAYQSQAEVVGNDADADGYAYHGPRSKRLTAEQFVDAVWQITGTAPQAIDAPIQRGSASSAADAKPLAGVWIWTKEDTAQIAANETIAFRRRWKLNEVPTDFTGVVSCDNAYTLFMNGQRVHAGDNWEVPDRVPLPHAVVGMNEIILVAKNGGSGPNPAGLFFEARWSGPGDTTGGIATDASWEWSKRLPNDSGRYAEQPTDWQAAKKVYGQQTWMGRLEGQLAMLLNRRDDATLPMVRASLVKSDFLMRSLGRPNRDQIVSVRPLELTTFEAINLSNGEALAGLLRQGADKLMTREWKSANEFIDWLFKFALGREPSGDERRTLIEAIGPQLTATGVEDVLWSVVMLPEFQIVR